VCQSRSCRRLYLPDRGDQQQLLALGVGLRAPTPGRAAFRRPSRGVSAAGPGQPSACFFDVQGPPSERARPARSLRGVSRLQPVPIRDRPGDRKVKVPLQQHLPFGPQATSPRTSPLREEPWAEAAGRPPAPRGRLQRIVVSRVVVALRPRLPPPPNFHVGPGLHPAAGQARRGPARDKGGSPTPCNQLPGS